MIRITYLSVFILILLSACAAPRSFPEQKDPSFHILSEQELQWDMQQMAGRITSILFLTHDENLTIEQLREQIVSLLNGIERIASDIRGNNVITNYSVVNRYMGSFLYDVSLAREFALQDPPNLVPAQRLIKSCLSCHESI